jgi:hypothetical protein
MRTRLISIPSPTSKAIAREMGDVSRYRKRDLTEAENLIRWGSTKTVRVTGKELNTREGVLLASDKPECRRVLREAGLPVPTESETDFPVIGRSRKHRAGDNFYLCENEEDVERAKMRGAVYFSKVYPKKDEYRIHVASGRVLLMSIKEGDKTQLIWNKAKSNFNFRHLRRSVWLEDEKLRDMARKAKKALKAIGLDFGAVDMMAGAGRGHKPFVISEINTAPNLSPLAISKYCNYFREQFEMEDEEGEEDVD